MALTKITSDVIGSGAIESGHIASGAIGSGHLTSIDTDSVSEGSTNTYFTNARARGSISVTGGNLAYDSSTGVLQLTDSEIQDALSAGTGVSYSGGQISIGQAVGTSDNVAFGNITTTGYLRGPSTFTIDPAAHGDNTGTLVIAGNLQVDGTTTTINSTTLTVDDKNIVLASGAADASAANGAGLTVDGANATFIYNGTDDEWDFNKGIHIAGTSSLSSEFKIGNLTWNQNTGSTSGLLHQYRGSDGYSELQINNTSTSGAITLNIRNDSNSVATIANNGDAYFKGDVEIASSQPRLHLDRSDGSYSWSIYNGDGTGNFPTSTFNIANNAGTAVITALDNGNVGIGATNPEESLHVVGQAVFENEGNTNRGNIIMGSHGSGTNKWATLTATHYNEATGSGNGSGNAGIMMIGSESAATYNKIWIGHGPYELNPATQINFGTHSATTHNLGGTTNMFIKDGNVGIGRSDGPWKKLDVKNSITTAGSHIVAHIGGNNHAAAYAVGLGFDPEGYGYRNKIAIFAEGTGLGYSRGRLHFALRGGNNGDEATISDSKMCILENGNIGIGSQVDNPSGTLDIRGGRAGIISTDSSWGQFRVANSGVGEVGITIANGCTATEYLSDTDPTASSKFILGIHAYSCGTDTFGIGHAGVGDSVMHIDGSGNFGFGTGTDNPVSNFEFSKTRSGVSEGGDYLTKMTINAWGYAGSNYRLGLLQFLGGDTAGANDNFYAAIGARTQNGANNQEDGILDFHVKTAGYTDSLSHQIMGDGNPTSQIAGGGSVRQGMLFRWPGIAIDRSWGNYPGIAVLNSSTYSASSTTQAEFRIHGTNGSSASYPKVSGADFSVNVRADGSFIQGSDRRRKTNITSIDNALEKVNQLTGKRFQTVNRAGEVNEYQSKADNYKFGLIAQEVEDIIPEATKYYADEDDGTEGWNSSYSIDYPSLTALLINAIKEQDTTIQDLKTRIEALEE